MKFLLLVAFLFSFLQGCATNPPERRITQTISGSPEILVKAAKSDDIRLVILNILLADGWRITSDYGVNFTLSRPMSSSEAAGYRFADSLISGKRDGDYSLELTFSIIEGNGSYRVIGRTFVISQFSRGQTTRNAEESPKVYNDLQRFLLIVEDSLKR